MAIEYNFTLDMDRSKRDNNIAYARTGDVDSITINADLVLNGTAYTPTGTNAFFECITPNGHSIRVAASKTGSAVSVDVPPAAFQAAGVINVAYFRFETGSSDNPTYVESTEPFAIVVREGIGDNIDTGDYIEDWRALADKLEAIVAEVEQKAEQAETAINEQKTEVDQLKAQVQVSIAQDAEDVSDAKDTAISNINSSQGAVDAAIDKLEQKTQEAVDAAQEALDGTLATDLQNRIDRTLKLDVADMVNISNNTSLSSLTAVGSYCCKTAATAATISDSPVDDSPFNMYVFSSATSGQVMQLVVPIDINSKPVAEWHVRFGTSSAMDPWSVIGGGADIAAGLGIDVTGDVQKTVAIDTDAFYQHHEAAEVIQGSTEVTGGGRIKELAVYGATRQNLWVNPSGESSGIVVRANDDGSVTLSGTATSGVAFGTKTVYNLRLGTSYTLSIDKAIEGVTGSYGFWIRGRDSSGTAKTLQFINSPTAPRTFILDSSVVQIQAGFQVPANTTVSGTYRVMLNEGTEAQPWCPPGLNGVEELSIVTAGKNLFDVATGTANGVILSKNNDGTYTLSGTCTAATFFRSSGVDGLTSEKAFPDGTYALSVSIEGSYSGTLFFRSRNTSGTIIGQFDQASGSGVWTLKDISCFEITVPDVFSGSAVIRVQLELGSTATAYEPPNVTTTPVDLDGHTLNSLPDGTRDELRIDSTGAVTLVQRAGVALYDGTSTPVASSEAHRVDTMCENDGGSNGAYNAQMCDKLPATSSNSTLPRAVVSVNNRYGISVYTVANPGDVDFVEGLAPIKMLYALATPKKIDLGSVSLPDLASPDYTVFASSNVPVEIEAEVVKVDYLPAPDVYTKEEVDKKIEASSMPDIVPVSNGGTGVTTAAAERNRLGLGNTTGALPVANGGTGAATSLAANYNLLCSAILRPVGDSVNDNTSMAFFTASPSTTVGALQKIPFLAAWNYIVGKIRSTFGFNSSNVLTVAKGGTGSTSASEALTALGAAKGVVTSVHQSLTGSTDVTSSLSSTVHTRFTLNNLLAWLKEQGLGGSQDGMVAGVIYPYTGSTIPNGFLLCDGAAVSRTTYSKLFDAIGTTYGSGDGSTTFNLPNLKQRMLIGSGDGMQTGSTGGSNTHQHEYGVTFGEYYNNIVKPLCTYDYDTSAASDNVVRLGNTPAGTQINAGTQEGTKNPASLPYEYVAYGKTKKSDSLPQYLVVNYIISTGDVDATARSDSFSKYPTSIEKGGTGSTSAKAAQNSLLNDMNMSSDALTDSSMLVGYNASPSASNGAVHKRSVSTVWDYIASKVADKVWEQIKTKAVRSDTTTGTDLTLVGGLESMSQTRTSTLTLGINEMSLDNSNAAPLTVNGEEVITEGNISSHLPATFDAKSVWFSTPLTQGQQKNIITEGGFTLEELRKYFVPGNLVLANMVCGGDHGVQYETVVPMVIILGDGMVMQPTGITYNSIADAHFDCIFAVANNEQAGDSGGTGLADGVTLLYSVTEVPGYANRTSTSSLKGFTVFDVVSHAI